MTVCGKPGKRWCCFPPFPQTLEIDEADSHIPTATTMTRMSQTSSKPGRLRDTHSEGKITPSPPRPSDHPPGRRSGHYADFAPSPFLWQRLRLSSKLLARLP